MITEARVLELLTVMPMSRRELAREFSVPWQSGELNAALMALVRRGEIDLQDDSYPERWALKGKDGGK